MSWDQWREIITVVLVLLTAVMTLAAGVGILRFPDTLSRLHAGSKPQVLGVIAVAVAVALQNPTAPVITTALLIIAFQMLTQPISVHMVGRSSYRSRHLRSDLLLKDELAEHMRKMEVATRADQLEFDLAFEAETADAVAAAEQAAAEPGDARPAEADGGVGFADAGTEQGADADEAEAVENPADDSQVDDGSAGRDAAALEPEDGGAADRRPVGDDEDRDRG